MMLLRLFVEFFQIGLLSVGGGLATLPFLYRLADKSHWLSYAQIADMIAVSESTPGAIGVNLATYTGYLHAGIPGALTATLGLILPSIIIIIIIAHILNRFKESALVQALFSGLRPAATGLIAAAGSSVLVMALFNTDASVNMMSFFKLREILLFVVIFTGMRKFRFHPVFFIGFAGLAGIVLGI